MDADEDPLDSTIAELKEKPTYLYKGHASFKFYGNARFRYTDNRLRYGVLGLRCTFDEFRQMKSAWGTVSVPI
jgi:hypothetical protein